MQNCFAPLYSWYANAYHSSFWGGKGLGTNPEFNLEGENRETSLHPRMRYLNIYQSWWMYTCTVGEPLDLWEWAIASHGRLLVPPGWLQVTCVGHCSICQIKNVVKYFWHTGGVEIRSDLIVGDWYFMWHSWVLTICQKLPSDQWRLHDDHVIFYRLIPGQEPSSW